jgi:hypothetical protein
MPLRPGQLTAVDMLFDQKAMRRISSEIDGGNSNMSIIEHEVTGLERVEAVEGEIREFMRSDAAIMRRPTDNDCKIVSDNIPSVIQRVSANGVREIDRLISDLKILRERLHDEGERVQREIVEYAAMSHAAMQWSKIIAWSLRHRKGPDATRLHDQPRPTA